MTPILYAANETNFNKNFGLGTLPDCTSCVVTEERNGVYELEFSYPITGQNYAELSPDRIVKVKPNEKSDPQLFRIYRNSKPINGIVKFYCQHISYDLNTVIVMPKKLTGVPGRAAMQYILSNCITTRTRPNRFSVGTVTVGNGNLNIREPSPARKCLGGMEGSLLDGFHGEFEFDNFAVNLRESRGQDTGVTILYGKNLTDITSETSIADTYTSVCPYYRNDDETVNTIKSKNMFSGSYNPAPSSTISYMRLNVGKGKFTLFTDMPLREDNYTNLFFLPGDISAGASTNVNGVWLGHPRTVTALGGYVTIAYRSESGISPADYSVTIVDGNLDDVDDVSAIKISKSLIMLDDAGNYGSERTIAVDLTDKFEEEEEYSTVSLISKAESYISKSNPNKIRQNIEIAFAPLWQTEEYKDYALLERVGLCDTVTVKYEALGVSAKAKVIKTVYDVLNERYIKIELGDARSNFATTLLELNENLGDLANTSVNKSAMQRAIENATRLITGAEGGYVLIRNQIDDTGEKIKYRDLDGRITYVDVFDGMEDTNEDAPGEILIMDKPDYKQAMKMWRWNLGGLGYSKNGYLGPFETAITMDGAIVANFITAGELNAGVITTGILKDELGANYWNLNTGEFRLTSSTKIKGIGYGNEKTLSDYVKDESYDIAGNVAEDALEEAAKKLEEDYFTQEKIFNTLTDNGNAKGIFMTGDGQLYINASFLKSGFINANLIKTGVLNADIIKSGHLSADRIRAGTITTESGMGIVKLTTGKVGSGSNQRSVGVVSANKISLRNNVSSENSEVGYISVDPVGAGQFRLVNSNNSSTTTNSISFSFDSLNPTQALFNLGGVTFITDGNHGVEIGNKITTYDMNARNLNIETTFKFKNSNIGLKNITVDGQSLTVLAVSASL